MTVLVWCRFLQHALCRFLQHGSVSFCNVPRGRFSMFLQQVSENATRLAQKRNTSMWFLQRVLLQNSHFRCWRATIRGSPERLPHAAYRVQCDRMEAS
jgi:hypothetical protein